MNHGVLGSLVAAGLLALAPCFSGCGSGGSSDSGGGPPAPPLPTTTVGWTEFTASADTRTVFVSSSDGDDADDGLTEATAKATITAGKALMRTGFPDWLLLKAGDTWTNQEFGNFNKSGRSAAEPMLISSYGTGARPHVRTGNNDGIVMFGATPVAHLSVVGIHFEAHTYTGSEGSTGVFCLADSDDILFEDCMVEGYSDNFVVQGNITNFKIRRCIVIDSYADSASKHSQGIYAESINGLLVEECVFDHNGWRSGVAGAEETIFNHNIYVQSDCVNVTIRGNILAQASSHGLQLRPGGIVEQNLFLRNSIAMFAAGEDAGPPQTRVVDNVVLDGKDIDGSARGSGIEVFDSRNALIKNNIVAHKPPGVGDQSAFLVEGQKDDAMGVPYVIVFEDNISYEWNGTALNTNDTYTSLTVRNNILQDVSNSNYLIEVPSLLGNETFQNNQYFSNRATSSWFRDGGTSLNLAGWVSATSESGAQAIQVTFPEPDRTVLTYQTSLGRVATLNAFLAEARLQSKSNWRPAYTAKGVNDYIRAGFGR